jgi:hypothetical protein
MNIIKNIFTRIILLIIWFSFVSLLFTIVDFFSSDSTSSSNKTTSKTIKKEVKADKIISNYTYWYDFYNNYYNANLEISRNAYYKSIRNKENNYASTIGALYRVIYNSDKLDLNLVYEELDFIRRDRSLSKRRFAEIIVSMVQNIPYNIIVQESCSLAQIRNDSVNEMILRGYECEGNVYAGVYSPLEFVKKMKGDCDSRTLFIYTVLKKFNYDVVILNSDLYAHSIIGLNIPSSGRYKYYNGKRYYTWETTAKGYELGVLPADFSNIDYWYIALT